MKKLLLAGVATVALVGAASAADLGTRPAYKAAPVAPPVPVFSWTGCHVGAQVGYGWGHKNVFEGKVNSAGALTTSGTSGSGGIDVNGAIFGGQVGCDYQFGFGKGLGGGVWVVGIEGSFAGTNIDGKAVDPADPTDSGDHIAVKVDWLSSVTGRVGFAGWIPQTLLYIKGGGAWVRDTWDLHDVENRTGASIVTQNRSGWTIGGGIEWAFAPNWSAFVEYDHYDFGDKDVTKVPWNRFSDDFSLIRSSQTIETVKVGVNWRFGWGKAPVVARY
jgi:outer membrane immunogenic protein